jgi:hypothetical protein
MYFFAIPHNSNCRKELTKRENPMGLHGSFSSFLPNIRLLCLFASSGGSEVAAHRISHSPPPASTQNGWKNATEMGRMGEALRRKMKKKCGSNGRLIRTKPSRSRGPIEGKWRRKIAKKMSDGEQKYGRKIRKMWRGLVGRGHLAPSEQNLHHQYTGLEGRE